MPFKFPVSLNKCDIINIFNDREESLVRIKHDGTVELNPTLQKDEVATIFWQNVTGFIRDQLNLDRVESSILLVKSYNLLKQIFNKEREMTLESRIQVQKLIDRFEDLING